MNIWFAPIMVVEQNSEIFREKWVLKLIQYNIPSSFPAPLFDHCRLNSELAINNSFYTSISIDFGVFVFFAQPLNI